MRILHVSQPTEAGVALVVRQLTAYQVAHGFDVLVACPSEGPLAAEVREAGARHEDWPAGRAPGLAVARETERVRRIIGRVKPDVVHLHSSKAGLAGRLALRGRLPTVFAPHAWSFLVRGRAGKAALRWERLAARWCGALVCVSDGEREIGEQAGVHGRFAVVANGVDLDEFTAASAADRAAARSRLGQPASPLVVCVGRLTHQKGQDVLLRAWPSVVDGVPGARLVLIGEGPDESKLRAQATDGVELAGRRDDVADWLAASDVLALPSRWEGMSLSMLQGMARARSVVSTDVPGAREALSNGAGAVIPIEDDRALAEALVERLRDPARATAEGAVGRRTAVERYDLRRVGREILAVYEAVLARS